MLPDLPGGFTWWDVIVAVAIGIPVGVFLPVRPKYLLMDIIIAFAFFVSLTVVRVVEGTYNGIATTTGFLYMVFLATAFVCTKFNKNAQEKEKVIKYLDELPRD